MNKLICVFVTVIVLVASGAAGAQNVQIDLPGNDERMIVYGGFGSLKNDPAFQKFAREQDLHAFARDKIRGYPIGKTKVATSGKEVLAELSGRDGRAATVQDIQDAVETGLLYVATLVSSFEHRVLSEDSIDGGSVKKALYIVTATLVVSRAEDGVVVFAVPVSKIGGGAVDQKGNAARPTGEIFAELYRQAIPEALALVSKIVSMSNESFSDRHMVVAVHGGHPSLRKVFNIRDEKLQLGSVFCDGAPTSQESGKLWRLLTSYIAQDVTSKLARRGIAVVPPANWNAWTRSAADVVDTTVHKIGFSTIGGLSELNDNMELYINPAEADRKLIVQIGSLQQSEVALQEHKNIFYRAYRTPIRVSWFENPSPRECSKVAGKGVIFENSKPKFSRQSRMAEDRGKPPSLGEQAKFAWVAIMFALEGLEIR